MQPASQLKQNAAYDAHYLALAESFGCELWTADERFYRAATRWLRRRQPDLHGLDSPVAWVDCGMNLVGALFHS